MENAWFPPLTARDLDGHDVALPTGLTGERTVVLVAFARGHQPLVDSWVPWLRERVAADPTLRFYELATIGGRWRPAREVIDRGMAGAIHDPEARGRTLTVYTDVRRLTAALAIDRDTISVVLVDRDGRVQWRGRGRFDEASAAGLAAALAAPPESAVGTPGVEQFSMAFDARFRLPLAALGITPETAHVTLAPDRLVACFGPWSCHTVPTNIREVTITGPYRWYRAIGARLSLVDRGLTFGSTTARGVCLLFREPVPGLDPLGVLRHPGLTLTVAESEGFAVAARRAAGLPG